MLNLPKNRTSVEGGTITAVETIPLRIPFRTAQTQFKPSDRVVHEILIVRIKTDQGIEGIGEAYARRREGISESLTTLRSTIDDFIAPTLIGKNPLGLANLVRMIEEALTACYPAKGAVSDALMDLYAKILGVPLHTLFGGKARQSVTTATVLTIKKRWEETLEDFEQSLAKGFSHFHIKVGVDLEADVANLRRLRAHSPDASLRIDANACLSFDEALGFLKRIEPLNIAAAEQPLSIWNLTGMAELRRRVTIPIVADESITTRHDLINVISAGAAGAIQTKATKNSGIWECRKLWTIAEAAGLGIFPGNFSATSVSTSAVLGLAAAWPTTLHEGTFAYGISKSLAADIVINPVEVEGPVVKVSDRPGNGVELDDDALLHYRAD